LGIGWGGGGGGGSGGLGHLAFTTAPRKILQNIGPDNDVSDMSRQVLTVLYTHRDKIGAPWDISFLTLLAKCSVGDP
jgi:hypothetical protein